MTSDATDAWSGEFPALAKAGQPGAAGAGAGGSVNVAKHP
jgi:hypothetical protein